MARGDHIRVQRRLYTHHGIDCGDGMVIHYTGEVGQKTDACIARTTMQVFIDNSTEIETVRYGRHFDAEECIRRAESRLGECGYVLLWNNCEHFARWCATGNHISEQIRDRAASSTGSVGAGAATAMSIGAVSSAGVVAGLGGAGTMSGLAAVGAAVGGGMTAGVALSVAAPAVSVAAAGYGVYRLAQWLLE